MPGFEEHCRISELRTGKTYRRLHKWMDYCARELGVEHRSKRHGLNDIESVRRRWGDEGVEEFLIHVMCDYMDTSRKLLVVVGEMRREKKCLRKRLYGK